MTPIQEEAVYNFLNNADEVFTLDEITAFVHEVDSKDGGRRLSFQIAAMINMKRLAFPVSTKKWLSRRGCFEQARFVIKPTRIEIMNGILIPGHRCAPFANPLLRAKEYMFFWDKEPIGWTTTECDPHELYPYYSIFGEEYAPHYITLENDENEFAFSEDEDPDLVSICTVDMSSIYRESGFVPGDAFLVKTLDWENGWFSLEKAPLSAHGGKSSWSMAELADWVAAADKGFRQSFSNLGPGFSTEEQIAHAYFYGGRRMRDVPAYSLEEFLYEKTDSIETVPYGIETRFWFAGREIPDTEGLMDGQHIPDKTLIEEVLHSRQIPVSEFVVQAYIMDALYRGETTGENVPLRLVPPVITRMLHLKEWNIIANYVAEVFEEMRPEYTIFKDKNAGPIRQNVTELHTAVVEYAAELSRDDMKESYLPEQSFIVLSQIQSHAANLLDDLCELNEPSEIDLLAMNNAYQGMLDSYNELRDAIEDSLAGFRQSNILLVKNTGRSKGRLLQIRIGGTDVWRRVVVPETFSLDNIRVIIVKLFGWNSYVSGFFALNRRIIHSDGSDGAGDMLPPYTTVAALHERGIVELSYEHGDTWNVRIIFLSPEDSPQPVFCVAGENAPPPDTVKGPIRFRKDIFALETGNKEEKQVALNSLGAEFDPSFFNLDQCNRMLEKEMIH